MGQNPTAELTGNYADLVHGKTCNKVHNGKQKCHNGDAEINYVGNMKDPDDTFSSSESDSSDSAILSLESKSLYRDTLDDKSVSNMETEKTSVMATASNNGKSSKKSDKKWTIMQKEDVQGMLYETAGFQNHYNIKMHFWSRQGGLRF